MSTFLSLSDLGQPEDLEALAKHLSDIGHKDSRSGSPSPRKAAAMPGGDESDEDEEGPVREDGTLPASDMAPL